MFPENAEVAVPICGLSWIELGEIYGPLKEAGYKWFSGSRLTNRETGVLWVSPSDSTVMHSESLPLTDEQAVKYFGSHLADEFVTEEVRLAMSFFSGNLEKVSRFLYDNGTTSELVAKLCEV